jgi:hypothetical protein
MKYFLSILTLLFIPFSLFAINDDLSISKFTDQETIVSLSPAPAQTDVYPDTNVDVVFSVGLDEEHVKPNSVRLRHIDGNKIDTEGTISYIPEEKRLHLTPKSFLKPGVYEVDVKDIKAAKELKHNEIKNTTYRFKVADVTPVSLKIIPSPIGIKEGSTLNLEAAVVYSDDSENKIDTAVWSSKDSNILSVEQNATATGVKEGETSVTAFYKGLTSKETQALVYLEINGHRLPFEPDPAINNSTLLGIDANENGVRDDVERWIYFKYKDKHPIHIDIAMQDARGNKKVLEMPEKAKEIRLDVNSAMYCQFYYKSNARYFNKPILVTERIITKEFSEKIYFNTQERYDVYRYYNSLLSGGSYALPDIKDRKSFCDFNTSKYE